MEYNEILLDDSILDIDSWLPEEVFNEIAEVVFGKRKLNLSSFVLPISHQSIYKELKETQQNKIETSKAGYSPIDSKDQSYDASYSFKGAAWWQQ